MKTLMKLPMYIVLAVIILIAIMFIIREPLLRSDNPGILGRTLQDFFPPDDIYDCLVFERLDTSKQGASKYQFINKYSGGYDSGIVMSNYTGSLFWDDRYHLKLVVEGKFYSDNELLFTRQFVDFKGHGLFFGKKGAGTTFFYYRCPEDMPKNKLITCELRIIKPDVELEQKYGPIIFYIQKSSDL